MSAADAFVRRNIACLEGPRRDLAITSFLFSHVLCEKSTFENHDPPIINILVTSRLPNQIKRPHRFQPSPEELHHEHLGIGAARSV